MLPVCDHIQQPPAVIQSSVKEVKPVKDTALITYYLENYPEIGWLVGKDVKKTEEGNAKESESPSKILFGEQFEELDRTFMTLKCLELILDGNKDAYESFVKAQPETIKLTYENFMELNKMGELLLSKHPTLARDEIKKLFEVALVLGDLGKTGEAKDLFSPYGAKAPDHDDFYAEAMQVLKDHPHLCPSFYSLRSEAQDLLLRTSHLPHLGHINHIEGKTEMFSGFKASPVVKEKDDYALLFGMFIHLCDVSGALGHMNNESSIVMNNNTFTAIMITFEACRLLLSGDCDEMGALNYCLARRGEILGLNPMKNPMDRVLTRIGAMMRLFTFADGNLLKKVVSKLEEADKKLIVKHLSANESKSETRTPTYMPAVLANLANNPSLGKTKEERLVNALRIGLPFVAKVLEAHQNQVRRNEINPDNPLNFNPIAKVAKEAPFSIENAEFVIDPDGSVTLDLKNIENNGLKV